jgi:hypothetical protein
MMQAMAEFVKKRGDFIMSQQCRFSIHGWIEIAGEKGHRLL